MQDAKRFIQITISRVDNQLKLSTFYYIILTRNSNLKESYIKDKK